MENGCKNHSAVTVLRRSAAMTLAAVTALSLAACGNTDGSESAPAKEWAYVPEFITIDDENVDYYDMQLLGENIYYLSYDWDEETGESSQNICKYSLADQNLVSTPITWSEEGGNKSISRGKFAEDGTMYAIMYAYNDDYSESRQFLAKFDAEGKQVFSSDMTELVGEDSYVDTLAVDGEGRIYITGDSVIWLFDGEGNSQGTVSMEGGGSTWIDTMACGRDGSMYVGYNSYDGNNSTYVLCEVDFDGRKLGEPCEGVSRSSGFVAGTEYDFLMNDSTALYGYNLGDKERKYLFDWLDSDINGSSVRKFGQMEDGRIVAVIEDWESEDRGIALLTKKKAEEVPQKETILIATMGGSYDLQSKAVKFNKASDKYHISIKEYVNYDNFNENTWSDALANLNNDITSSNCPDMIDLSNVSVSQMAAKGVLEDLNPYLEQSGKLNREDFVENILNAYTYDEKLVCIPTTFSMQTVIGSTSMVGSEDGWTLEELMNLANEHPDAELFDKVSKVSILQTAMMFNEEAFINWETGECSFDTDGFKNILEFVNRFPDEVNWEEGMDSEPTRIQNGEVLLASAYIYDFQQLQMYNEMFQGEYTCVGFPTVDGTGGHALSAGGGYAITTKSDKKEGAWAFLESILASEEDDRWRSGFPTKKTKLQEMAEKAVTPDYVTDENGEIVMDENGEPIISSGASSTEFEDGWSYTYRMPTQEEVDKVMELMNVAEPVFYNGDDEISKIINEEAEAFFKGQKSVDEVAGIIQNRIHNYVGENR